MSAPNPAANSLLTEHLQYTPLSVIDDIINTINGLIYKSVIYVEQLLQNADPVALGFKATTSGPENGVADSNAEGGVSYPPEAKLEIEEGIHKLETLFESTIDRDFDKLEIYALRNVFMVPDDVLDWMRLRHYEGLNFNPPSDAPTRESIKLQRHKLLETQKLHVSLLRESTRNAQLIAQLRSLLSVAGDQTRLSTTTAETGDTAGEAQQQQPAPSNPFAFLTAHPAAVALNVGTSSTSTNPTHHPITDTTSFTLSQVPHLQSLLATVRPSLATLRIDTNSDTSTPDERRQYIEGQTRRHLQVTQGLELGEQGEIRDGEWQGRGKRPGDGQVKDLEMVVGILGGAAAGVEEEVEEKMDEGE